MLYQGSHGTVLGYSPWHKGLCPFPSSLGKLRCKPDVLVRRMCLWRLLVQGHSWSLVTVPELQTSTCALRSLLSLAPRPLTRHSMNINAHSFLGDRNSSDGHFDWQIPLQRRWRALQSRLYPAFLPSLSFQWGQTCMQQHGSLQSLLNFPSWELFPIKCFCI
jgi:hypothetical protein